MFIWIILIVFALAYPPVGLPILIAYILCGLVMWGYVLFTAYRISKTEDKATPPAPDNAPVQTVAGRYRRSVTRIAFAVVAGIVGFWVSGFEQHAT